MTALATVSDTAETLPTSLKAAMAHSAGGEVTLVTTSNSEMQMERRGL